MSTTEFITKSKPGQTVWSYRIAIIFFCLFSLNALGSCIVASLLEVDWTKIPPQKQFIICVTIFVNWTGTILAFFSTHAKQVGNVTIPPQPIPAPPQQQ